MLDLISALVCSIIGAIGSLFALVAVYVLRPKTQKNSKIVIASAAAFGIFTCAIAVLSVYMQFLGPPPPTLEELVKAFPGQRPTLEKMKHMSDEDPGFILIEAEDVNRPSSSTQHPNLFHYPDPQAPLSRARWDEYRKELEPFGSHSGISRTATGDVSIMFYNGLWRKSYVLVGYTHCAESPTAPMWNSLPAREPPCGSDSVASTYESTKHRPDEHQRDVDLGHGWHAFDYTF